MEQRPETIKDSWREAANPTPGDRRLGQGVDVHQRKGQHTASKGSPKAHRD